MNFSLLPWRPILAAAWLLVVPLAPARACTDVLLKTDNHQMVSGRNMDYPRVFRSKVLVTPAGKAFQSPVPAGFPALAWVSRYGYVGVTGGTPFIADGMNVKGLSIDKQTLAATRYPDPVKDRPNLDIRMICDWVLGNCSSVDEVANALPSLNPIETTGKNPLHLALHDQAGNSGVIEFIQGTPVFHRNPNGVLTNGPTFDWHETHLKYYRWKRSVPNSAVAVPEGYFSAERFIRATLMRDALPASDTPRAAVADALRILAAVAPPYGMPGAYVEQEADGGHPRLDFTQWSVVRDHRNLVYYYKSFDSPGLKAIDLKTLDLTGKTQYVPLPVGDGEWSVPAPLTPEK